MENKEKPPEYDSNIGIYLGNIISKFMDSIAGTPAAKYFNAERWMRLLKVSNAMKFSRIRRGQEIKDKSTLARIQRIIELWENPYIAIDEFDPAFIVKFHANLQRIVGERMNPEFLIPTPPDEITISRNMLKLFIPKILAEIADPNNNELFSHSSLGSTFDVMHCMLTEKAEKEGKADVYIALSGHYILAQIQQGLFIKAKGMLDSYKSTVDSFMSSGKIDTKDYLLGNIFYYCNSIIVHFYLKKFSEAHALRYSFYNELISYDEDFTFRVQGWKSYLTTSFLLGNIKKGDVQRDFIEDTLITIVANLKREELNGIKRYINKLIEEDPDSAYLHTAQWNFQLMLRNVFNITIDSNHPPEVHT